MVYYKEKTVYATIQLLNGSPTPLTYSVPAHLQSRISINTLVLVPVKKKIIAALVMSLHQSTHVPVDKIRPLSALLEQSCDPLYRRFIEHAAELYCIPSYRLLRCLGTAWAKESAPETTEITSPKAKNIILSQEQQKAVEIIEEQWQEKTKKPLLLQGVTGSGKTELYKYAIQKAYAAGKSTLLLLPEVSLAASFTTRLKRELAGEIPLYQYHSAMAAAERTAVWEAIKTETPCCIIGVHLPILLPITTLGCIIIDEEHDVGYQEKRHPKLNTKELALLRAQILNIPSILGSATPSVQTWQYAQMRNWHQASLTQRYQGSWPTISVAKLSKPNKKSFFWISPVLKESIEKTLTKKEQVLLFLNRRGYSRFVQCTTCGYVYTCSRCAVSLTVHHKSTLQCHYCGLECRYPSSCAGCNQSDGLQNKGVGTQQLVEQLHKLYPAARIARADLDSTRNKKEWQKTMADFSTGALDILVGTQTITKGYDFHNVTLVGVVWADSNIAFPFFNSREVAVQQILQVAGRAGRGGKASTVILQTISDQPLFTGISEASYPAFIQEELEIRKLLHYPPYTRFCDISMYNNDEEIITKESHTLALAAEQYRKKNGLNAIIIGPSAPPVDKIGGIYQRKIYIKTDDLRVAQQIYNTLLKEPCRSSLWFTPTPLQF